MSDIIDILKNAPEYIGGNGRTDTEIEAAEKQRFPDGMRR